MADILQALSALISGKRMRQAARVLKLLVAAACAICVLGRVAGSPRIVWNGARLAPTFSLLAGHPPYYPMDHGPILNTIYGPFTDLYYLPCGLFYHHVTLAIITGSLLSLAAFVFPVLFIIWRRRQRLSLGWGLWLALLCVLQLLTYSSLGYSAFYIHADAPAVLFAALCVLLLEGGDGEQPSWRAIFLSAFFGTLAAWSKQTLVLILMLPLATACTAPGTRWLRLALVGWVAALSALIFLVLALWCGGGAVLDNLWRIPSSQPMSSANFLGIQRLPAAGPAAKLKATAVEMHIITGKYLAPYLLCTVAAVLLLRLMNGKSPAIQFRPGRLSALFFAGALLALPGGAAGLLKAGGFINNESPFIWFMVLGFLSLITDRDPGRAGEPPGGVWEIGRVIYPIFAAIGLLGLAAEMTQVRAAIHQIANPFDNDQETAVRICRLFPGQYYFPWHPLAGLVADGKLYHFEYGVQDRASVGKGPDATHLYANIPAEAKIMAWPKAIMVYTNDYLVLTPTNGPPGIQTDQFDWYSLERQPERRYAH
jgi:hypothetical protein